MRNIFIQYNQSDTKQQIILFFVISQFSYITTVYFFTSPLIASCHAEVIRWGSLWKILFVIKIIDFYFVLLIIIIKES